MITELPFTLTALRQAYAGGLRPELVVSEAFRRLEAASDPGIFIYTAKEQALQAASALGEPDGTPLWGVPFAVKDNIDVAGMPTTAACPDFSREATFDAFVVARLRKLGAIALGKTNLDQFATGLVGVRTPYPSSPERARSRDRAGRLLIGLGSRSCTRHCHLCARHRYSRIRSRTGGPERDCWTETNPGSLVRIGSGSCLPHARHDIDFCDDGGRCLGGLQFRGRVRS